MTPDVLDINPRTIAKHLMEKGMRHIRLFSETLHKDCRCVDHEGPHEPHVSRLRLLENYGRLHQAMENYGITPANIRLVSDLLMFFDAEMDRQSDLITDSRLNAWAYSNRTTDFPEEEEPSGSPVT